ncbi:hypothetical protein ACJX0J_035611 [Zea mays]
MQSKMTMLWNKMVCIGYVDGPGTDATTSFFEVFLIVKLQNRQECLPSKCFKFFLVAIKLDACWLGRSKYFRLFAEVHLPCHFYFMIMNMDWDNLIIHMTIYDLLTTYLPCIRIEVLHFQTIFNIILCTKHDKNSKSSRSQYELKPSELGRAILTFFHLIVLRYMKYATLVFFTLCLNWASERKLVLKNNTFWNSQQWHHMLNNFYFSFRI